jgi:translation initiation factor 3 subunit C
MSRFFHGAASESDSESSSEESAVFSEEEEEEDIEASTPGIRVPSAYAKTGSAAGTAKTAFSRFLRDEESSDDESSKARVVRSAKDKMYDDLKVTIKSMENGKKINDWVAIQNGTWGAVEIDLFAM